MTFLSIIIPAYNEEMRLPNTLINIINYINKMSISYEIVVVDNGSTDSTFFIAEEYSKRYSNIKVIKEVRRGKGFAVHTGMLSSRGYYRFMCDADLSMPIDEITKFLPPRMNMDIGIGIRENVIGEPLIRRFSGKVFNGLVNFLLQLGIKDTQCGFKMFKGEVAELIYNKQTIYGWTFDVEILYIAKLQGLTISQIPITWYFDPRSKIRLAKDSWLMLKDILRIKKNAKMNIYS